MCEILDELAGYTYAVQHNPNCPKPYCVRLPGAAGRIDNLSHMTEDAVGYGMTLAEAALNAGLADDRLRKARGLKPLPRSSLLAA